MAKQEELALDLRKFKKVFKKAPPETLITWALVIAVMILVFWIRMLPAALPIADDWAQQSIQGGLRNQISAQIAQQYPALPDANRNQLIDEQVAQFMAANEAAVEQQQEQLSEDFRSRLRYEGDNGKQYTYLGDLDSYFWIRYTRNWLETGTPCDVITPEGQCRDMYVLMPIGSPMGENPSTHVFVIGWLHKFLTTFDENRPLPATSFLVPVWAGVLGVIPAFFIGRRLAGNAGGVVASVVISLHPLLLQRSMGSDNDVWNVVVPLFIMWMAIEALEAKQTKQRIIYSTLAGILVGIQGTFWIGWWFIYLIVFLAMLGSLLFVVARYAIRKRNFRVWKDATIKNLAIVFLVFYIVSMIMVVSLDYRTVGGYIKQPIAATSAGATLDRAVLDSYWPNVLTTVAELNKSSFMGAVGNMGGRMLFFGCLVGLLLMILPRKLQKWTWEHYGVVAVGALISVYLLNSQGLGKFTVLFLLGLPIGIIVLLDLFRDYKVDVTAALIVLVWFLATVYAAYSGVRFILLMIPAFGIGLAVTAGRIYEWITEYVRKEFNLNQYLVYGLVAIFIVLLLVTPVKNAHGTARVFAPTISDAWWDTLTNIEENTSPDAAINSWWDFGHWFKYVADRRVTADGTTQGTHVPRWLGLSLVSPDERESVGVLRMLNCGSDAYPTEEGSFGAYGRLFERVEDTILAERMVRDLVVLDRPDAVTYLEERDFAPEDIDDVLNATHCAPVEDYFITSGDMVGKAGVWAHFGLWDFERAFVAEESRTKTQDEAVPNIMEMLDISQEEATKMYFEVRGLQTEGEVNAYVSPWPGYITHNWLPCQSIDNGSIIACPLRIAISNQGNQQTVIDEFVYYPEKPDNSTMIIALYANGQRTQATLQAPDKFVVADEEIGEVKLNGTGTNIGVLLDVPQNRILLADPHHVESTFTKLFYLEGRYSPYFTKFDDKTTFSGLRILTWQVNWTGVE